MTRRNRNLFLCSAALGLFVLFLSISSLVPVKRELGWIDAYTATMKHETSWFGREPTHAHVAHSALDAWAVEHGFDGPPDWRLVIGTRRNLWGWPTSYGHGAAPPVYALRGDPMNLFVGHATDEELAGFIATMRRGSEAEREVAVALEEAIEALGRQAP